MLYILSFDFDKEHLTILPLFRHGVIFHFLLAIKKELKEDRVQLL